jgi:hypothetical protein
MDLARISRTFNFSWVITTLGVGISIVALTGEKGRARFRVDNLVMCLLGGYEGCGRVELCLNFSNLG